MEHNMQRKYKLSDKREEFNDGTVIHQIQALREGPWGPAGTLGGWVESEYNLDHKGDCWIYGESVVDGNMRVCGDHTIGLSQNEDDEDFQIEDFCNLDTEDDVSNTTENKKEYNTEVEAFVGTVGLRVFNFLVIALAILIVGAAVWFVVQSIYVILVLILSLVSLFGFTS